MPGSGMAAWLHYQRYMKRISESVPKAEQNRRQQAFRALFSPIMNDMGFSYRRNAFWKRCDNEYVQYVMLRNARGMPGVYYIGCGYEWALARHARIVVDDGLKCAFQKWYSSNRMFINTLQRFVGACDHAETIGYGCFDDADSFDEGLNMEYARFIDAAYPILQQTRTVKDYLLSKNTTSWSTVLGHLIMNDYHSASMCCDQLLVGGSGVRPSGNVNVEAAHLLQSAIQQRGSQLIDAWIASCCESVSNDLRFIP